MYTFSEHILFPPFSIYSLDGLAPRLELQVTN